MATYPFYSDEIKAQQKEEFQTGKEYRDKLLILIKELPNEKQKEIFTLVEKLGEYCGYLVGGCSGDEHFLDGFTNSNLHNY